MTDETPQTWRPTSRDDDHIVLPFGEPRSEKVMGPDGKEHFRCEMLVEADGELRLWTFGMGVFKQLQTIHREFPTNFHTLTLYVRRIQDQRGIPRIEITYDPREAP